MGFLLQLFYTMLTVPICVMQAWV